MEHKYRVFAFHEGHDHCLSSPSTAQFLRSSRKMTILHNNFIANNNKVNVGLVRSFRMFKEQVGGYDNVGATMQDFKNFHRDMKEYIKDEDAKMLVENFIRKRDLFEGFYFDYDLDDEFHVSHLYWADAICRKNYALFGDMVSFDATYETNKYSIVFVPFTGVDHHKSCITFGVGLLSRETTESFIWLFRTFLRVMGDCEPKCIITNQDPVMRAVIKQVFVNTKHRLCMWHIIGKVPEKISPELRTDSVFLNKLTACVWNTDQEPMEFETRWKSIMVAYQLERNEWLKYMYEIREKWIPAYFRDLFLGGIMRTTSRSESENSFFGNFTNPHVTLVEFYLRFESAMDSQRHKQSKLNSDSKSSFPQLKTPLPLERHASSVYTHKIFYIF